jgi:valyl-tRNA synthetase
MEKKESDLSKLYPTDLLVTGFDIIFFWVARMVLMGVYNTGLEPFKTVYIHGLIRDRFGEKMSKTKGNVVDPLEMIEKYGADALRFGLAVQTVPGSDIKFNEKRIEGYKHFANKIWNASRYVISNLPEGFQVKEPLETDLQPEDRWILYRLNETVKEVRRGLDSFDFAKSANALYRFFWDEYCDWYIEFSKDRVYKGGERERESALNTLVYVLDKAIKLLHPFMPFITEEIWSFLPTKDQKSVSLSSYPQPREEFESFKGDAQKVEFIKGIISDIRNFRTVLEIPLSKRLTAYYRAPEVGKLLENFKGLILKLARLEDLIETQGRPEDTLVIPFKGGEIYISVKDTVNVEEVRQIQLKKREKLLKELQRVESKLNNPKFVEKAPKHIVERERNIYEELKLELQKVENILKLLEG